MSIETLQEFMSITGGRTVDRARGIIPGVRILNRESRNGRTYTDSAIAAAASLYEGRKVYTNHPKGSATGPRDVGDLFGRLRNVTVISGGLTGDLHANPKHPMFEQVAWAAENDPQAAGGLSHNVEARIRRVGGKQVVESIENVISVDLVADPATTSGLYEHVEDGDPSPAFPFSTHEEFVAALRGQETGADMATLEEQILGESVSPADVDGFVRDLRHHEVYIER